MQEINLQELKEIDKELLKRIIGEFDYSNGLEDVSAEVDGKRYSAFELEEGSWEDDGRGKYFYQTSIYILGLCEKDGWKCAEKYNVIITQNATKTGSYYTDWNYEYDDPTFKQAYGNVIPEKIIPAQIIPEHIVIAYKDLEL